MQEWGSVIQAFRRAAGLDPRDADLVSFEKAIQLEMSGFTEPSKTSL